MLVTAAVAYLGDLQRRLQSCAVNCFEFSRLASEEKALLEELAAAGTTFTALYAIDADTLVSAVLSFWEATGKLFFGSQPKESNKSTEEEDSVSSGFGALHRLGPLLAPLVALAHGFEAFTGADLHSCYITFQLFTVFCDFMRACTALLLDSGVHWLALL